MSEHTPRTTHTPGPWEVHGDDTQELFYIHGANAICDMRRDTRFHCSPREREANARLIAAAPALLEACKRLLRAFEADAEKAPKLDILTCWETNSQAIDAARAAIAMAEGKV